MTIQTAVLIETLVELGADGKAENNGGVTPYDYVRLNKYLKDTPADKKLHDIFWSD